MRLRENIDQVLMAQKKYFATGETRDISFRLKQLQLLKELIQSHETEIFQALKADLGRGDFETFAAEIGYLYSTITDFSKKLKKWAKPKKVKTPLVQFGSKSYIHHEPYGTVLVIGPFNYPFSLVFDPLVGAIGAGNCAVIKPSEQTPATAKLIEAIIKKGFKEAYIAVFQGEKETTTELLDSDFDYIFFTGSIFVGKIVMAAAAKRLIPVTLELGGKSPVIVTEDAKLDVAADRIIWGKLFNAGQTCIAPDYILVHNSVKDLLLEKLKERIEGFYGKDSKQSSDLCRIVSKRHTERLIQMIDGDKALLYYGGDYDIEQKYIAPTLLKDVTGESASMKDEIFGPILPVMGYESLKDTVTFINKRPKPLALYIFSENNKTIVDLIREIPSGDCCINDVLSHVTNHNLPFGGVGSSGLGFYHGIYSFETFSHKRSVMRKSTWINLKMIYPPHPEKKIKLLRKLFK